MISDEPFWLKVQECVCGTSSFLPNLPALRVISSLRVISTSVWPLVHLLFVAALLRGKNLQLSHYETTAVVWAPCHGGI